MGDPWEGTPARTDPKQPLPKLDPQRWIAGTLNVLGRAARVAEGLGRTVTAPWKAAVEASLQRQKDAASFAPGPGLKITGDGGGPASPADQKAFLDMVRREMATSPSFHRLMLTINADKRYPVTVVLGRNQTQLTVDSYDSDTAAKPGLQEVDLADFQRLPVDPPSAFPNAITQGEALAHSMAEAYEGANSTGSYGAAHAVGISAQNQYRDDRGQQGHRLPPPDDSRKTADGVRFTYWANEKLVHMEEWKVTKGNIRDIERIK